MPECSECGTRTGNHAQGCSSYVAYGGEDDDEDDDDLDDDE